MQKYDNPYELYRLPNIICSTLTAMDIIYLLLLDTVSRHNISWYNYTVHYVETFCGFAFVNLVDYL